MITLVVLITLSLSAWQAHNIHFLLTSREQSANTGIAEFTNTLASQKIVSYQASAPQRMDHGTETVLFSTYYIVLLYHCIHYYSYSILILSDNVVCAIPARSNIFDYVQFVWFVSLL